MNVDSHFVFVFSDGGTLIFSTHHHVHSPHHINNKYYSLTSLPSFFPEARRRDKENEIRNQKSENRNRKIILLVDPTNLIGWFMQQNPNSTTNPEQQVNWINAIASVGLLYDDDGRRGKRLTCDTTEGGKVASYGGTAVLLQGFFLIFQVFVVIWIGVPSSRSAG